MAGARADLESVIPVTAATYPNVILKGIVPLEQETDMNTDTKEDLPERELSMDELDLVIAAGTIALLTLRAGLVGRHGRQGIVDDSV